MATMIYNVKRFIPTPPDKGSFPLDHEGLCRKQMLKYMMCLHTNKSDNSSCKQEAKDYLGCRMDNKLMDREEWGKLGYTEDSSQNTEEKVADS